MSALKIAKSNMPRHTHYVADLAFEIGATFGVDPIIILAITKHESGWGDNLKPTGPGGTGDFIPRVKTEGRLAAVAPVAGFTQQLREFKVKNKKGKWLTKIEPTVRGWGHGLFQIDIVYHAPFIASGKWAEPRAAMAYSVEKVYKKNQDDIKKAFPSLSGDLLVYATIASYNAGASGVIKALRSGVPPKKLDQGKDFDKGGTRVTYGENYVVRILGTANKLRTPGVV